MEHETLRDYTFDCRLHGSIGRFTHEITVRAASLHESQDIWDALYRSRFERGGPVRSRLVISSEEKESVSR